MNMRKKTTQLSRPMYIGLYLLCTTLFCCIMPQKTQAQVLSILKANTDNFFVQPNSAYGYLNMLDNDLWGDCDYTQLRVTIVKAPNHGTAQVTNGYRLRYRPTASYFGQDSLVYSISCNGSAVTPETTATIHITMGDNPAFMENVCHDSIPAIEFDIALVGASPEGRGTAGDPANVRPKYPAGAATVSIGVSERSHVLCGDIDCDGKTEFLVFDRTAAASSVSKNILVFEIDDVVANKLSLKYALAIQAGSFVNYSANSASRPSCFMAIASVDGAASDGNKYSSIFVTTVQGGNGGIVRNLIKYSFDIASHSFTEAWRVQYSPNNYYSNASPVVADFMGDGHAQVLVYDRLYDAATGKLMVNGALVPTTNNTFTSVYSFGEYGHTIDNPTTNRVMLTSAPAIGDIDGDGKIEIVGGNCVYKVNIDPDSYNSSSPYYANPSTNPNNTFTLFQKATVKAGETHPEVTNGGGTALADMDLDGQLDVIVTTSGNGNPTANGGLYIYNPRTGDIMNTNSINNIPRNTAANIRTGEGGGPSLPFVGDMDGDGYPEIALLGNLVLNSYKFDPVTKQLSLFWSLTSTDKSSSTTLSLFDFDQSGNAKLVYRDESTLRIIDGRADADLPPSGRIVKTFSPVTSTTVNEYPIIADVNKDGAAEIIVTGGSQANNQYATLRVYGSGNSDSWAPARSVWNQCSYNPVFINEDLTIPRYPINQASVFYGVDKNGNTTINRPYNNFLQQSTLLNERGEMLYKTSNLRFVGPPALSVDPGPNTATFTMQVENIGAKAFPAPIYITMYLVDATVTPNKYNLVGTPMFINETLDVGESSSVINYTVSNYSSIVFPSVYYWEACVNLAQNDIDPMLRPYEYYSKTDDYETESGVAPFRECEIDNNYMRSSSLGGEKVICKDASDWVTITPKNKYDYYWFDSRTASTPINPGFLPADSLMITKNAQAIQTYFIEIYLKGTNVRVNSGGRDTINVYMAPDTLVWTGLGQNQNWHDYKNWKRPLITSIDIALKNYPQANIPRKCTDVLIPDSIDNYAVNIYADLTNKALFPGNSTDYSYYPKSECANIWFRHGGEVMRTDSLDYDAAYVQLILEANRWYTLSAPLRSTYTGDYYVKNPNPLLDDIEMYTRLYSIVNPETGETGIDKFTGVFNSPNDSVNVGKGLSFWVDNKKPINVLTKHEFWFPKHNPSYNIYYRDGSIKQANIQTARDREHRFVYESVIQPNGDIALKTIQPAAGSYTLVGNPFMSHLNFEQFYTANSSLIEDFYEVLDKNNNWVTYTIGGINTGIDEYIAPMQSVMVKSKVNSGFQLIANPLMTLNRPGEKLRSESSEEEPRPEILSVEVYQGGVANKCLLIYTPDGHLNLNVPKFYVVQNVAAEEVPVTVYTRNQIGSSMDIQTVGSLEGFEIPVGIRTNIAGEFRLNFGGIMDFAPEYDIYLNDMETQTSYNLREGSMYTFTKKVTSPTALYDTRFTLTLAKMPTGILDVAQPISNITVFANNGVLQVVATNGSTLQDVALYDLQGRMITGLKDVNTSTVQIPVKTGQIYIVRAVSNTTTGNFKVYSK